MWAIAVREPVWWLGELFGKVRSSEDDCGDWRRGWGGGWWGRVAVASFDLGYTPWAHLLWALGHRQDAFSYSLQSTRAHKLPWKLKKSHESPRDIMRIYESLWKFLRFHESTGIVCLSMLPFWWDCVRFLNIGKENTNILVSKTFAFYRHVHPGGNGKKCCRHHYQDHHQNRFLNFFAFALE